MVDLDACDLLQPVVRRGERVRVGGSDRREKSVRRAVCEGIRIRLSDGEGEGGDAALEPSRRVVDIAAVLTQCAVRSVSDGHIRQSAEGIERVYGYGVSSGCEVNGLSDLSRCGGIYLPYYGCSVVSAYLRIIMLEQMYA